MVRQWFQYVEINITVLCTSGYLSKIRFYKYLPADRQVSRRCRFIKN